MASNGKSWTMMCFTVVVAFAAGCDGDVVGGTRQVEDDCTFGCEPERDDEGSVRAADDGDEVPEEVDPEEERGEGGEGGSGGEASAES